MIMPPRARMPKSATKPRDFPKRSIPQETPISPMGAVIRARNMSDGLRSWNMSSVMIMMIMIGTGTIRYFRDFWLFSRAPSTSTV